MLDGGFGRGSGARLEPPPVHGVARLATLAFGGGSLDDLLDLIGPPPSDAADTAGWLLDRSFANALCFRAEEAAVLQAEALALDQVFRIRRDGADTGPRLLVLMAPGGLMINAPVDFLTAATDVQVDLMFIRPVGRIGRLPEHDVALVAVSELAPAVLRRIVPLFDSWPRPILNDPRWIDRLSRDAVSARLWGMPGHAPAATVQASRRALLRHGPALLPGGAFPVLLRPLHSHGGNGLEKCNDAVAIERFLEVNQGNGFFMTQFIDYRGADGWYRKYRVAFLDGRPFICHMAAGDDWMVHYLSAGMGDSVLRRAAEAEAMAEFDTGFALRHAEAFAALYDAIKLEYFTVDCSQTQDGQLLLFEVDIAAIIHFMDPVPPYAYKQPPMRRCADALRTMLARRC